MTASLRYLRKLVLGETWTLPFGILAAVLALVVLGAWSPPWFASAGGFVLFGLLFLALSASLAGGGRRSPPP